MSHRSTTYPCFLPDLGEFSGSWSHKTYPTAKVEKISKCVRDQIPNSKSQVPNKFKNSNPKTQTVCFFAFWISIFVGIWCLVLGIYLKFGNWIMKQLVLINFVKFART
jgi:hypothetical protein